MRYFVLAFLAATPAFAGSGYCPQNLQTGTCSANVQADYTTQAVVAQDYSQDVQNVEVQHVVVAPVRQLKVIQRVVQPVYSQQLNVQTQYVAPIQQLNVQHYGVSQNLQVRGYGAQNLRVQNLRVRNHGVRQNLRVQNLQVRHGHQNLQSLNILGQRGTRTVTKSKTVTTTGSSGLLGRLLGR